MEDLFPQLGCLLAAIHFHKTLLHGVLRAPVTFFDITPTGRILSRFSKDVDVLDTGLSRAVSDTIYCVFEVISEISFFLSTNCHCTDENTVKHSGQCNYRLTFCLKSLKL